jgi:type IX secretion system PorP/SprF family membrane protein
MKIVGRAFSSFCLFVLYSFLAFGQDNIPFSQNYVNKVLINPAAVGMQDQIHVAVFARKEWTSFPGAPNSNMLVADMPFNHNSMGIGLRVFQESVLANDNWYAHLLYSYKINLNKGKLAFGMNLGLAQYNFNVNRLAIKDSDDQLLANTTTGRIHPDLGFGVLYTKKNFLAGFSVANMLKHPNNVFNPEISQGNVKPNYSGLVSQKIGLSVNWELEALVLGNYWNNRNLIGSGAVLFSYKKGFTFGGSYRTSKSAALMLGLRLDRVSAALENCTLGYSYDLNLGETRVYLNNTHEFTLAIKFDKPKNIQKENQKPKELSPYDL